MEGDGQMAAWTTGLIHHARYSIDVDVTLLIKRTDDYGIHPAHLTIGSAYLQIAAKGNAARHRIHLFVGIDKIACTTAD